jgi:hypothetical protein
MRTGEDNDERLLDVDAEEPRDAHTDGTQHRNFLCLLDNVGVHAAHEAEEADHHDHERGEHEEQLHQVGRSLQQHNS